MNNDFINLVNDLNQLFEDLKYIRSNIWLTNKKHNLKLTIYERVRLNQSGVR